MQLCSHKGSEPGKSVLKETAAFLLCYHALHSTELLIQSTELPQVLVSLLEGSTGVVASVQCSAVVVLKLLSQMDGFVETIAATKTPKGSAGLCVLLEAFEGCSVTEILIPLAKLIAQLTVRPEIVQNHLDWIEENCPYEKIESIVANTQMEALRAATARFTTHLITQSQKLRAVTEQLKLVSVFTAALRKARTEQSLCSLMSCLAMWLGAEFTAHKQFLNAGGLASLLDVLKPAPFEQRQGSVSVLAVPWYAILDLQTKAAAVECLHTLLLNPSLYEPICSSTATVRIADLFNKILQTKAGGKGSGKSKKDKGQIGFEPLEEEAIVHITACLKFLSLRSLSSCQMASMGCVPWLKALETHSREEIRTSCRTTLSHIGMVKENGSVLKEHGLDGKYLPVRPLELTLQEEETLRNTEMLLTVASPRRSLRCADLPRAAQRPVSTPVPKHETTRDKILCETRRLTLLTLASTAFPAVADTPETITLTGTEESSSRSPLTVPNRVFFEISVDRKPFGRIVVEIYDDVRIGGQRFTDLAIGKDGVRYQATKFIRLTENYVVNNGVKALSLIETADSTITGGESLDGLLAELDSQRHLHDGPGVVSLVVRGTDVRAPKKKLVAVRGKFETIEEGGGIGPNGTGFVITTAPAAELNASNLVVGRVVKGLDVVDRLRVLPTVKDNKGSVFYKAAKQIGDPRADIAEMSFGKPFNRITVAASGVTSP